MFFFPPEMSFWDTPYNTPGRHRIMGKRLGITYAWFLFMAPTALCLVGTYPGFLLKFADMWRPMEFPPQSDPEIINSIFHGKKPKNNSSDSYSKEEQKALKEISNDVKQQ